MTEPLGAAAPAKSPRPGSGLARSPLAWCFGLVTLEAIALLVGLGLGNAPGTGGDGPVWSQLGHNLAAHGVFSSADSGPLLENVQRTPGYPVVIALFDLIGFRPLLMLRIAQFGMVALTAWLVYGVAREIADEWTARVAAFLTATYLPLLGLASYTLAEVMAALLATLVVRLVIAVTRRADGSLAPFAGLGLAIAALAYVRPEYAPLVAVVAAVLVLGGDGRLRSRQGWTRAAVMVAVVVVALVPWTVRNAEVTGGHLVPLTAGSGGSLLASADQYSGTISAAMSSSDFATFLRQVAQLDRSVPGRPGPRRDLATDAAFAHAAEKIIAKVPLTTILEKIPLREVYLWQTADFPPSTDRSIIHTLGEAQYGILLLFMLVGAVASRRKLLRYWPLWMVAVYLSLLHAVFSVEGRYSIPARPALLVFAAIGVVACGRALRRHRGIVPAGTAAMLP